MDSTCGELKEAAILLLKAPGQAEPRINQTGKLSERQNVEVEQACQCFTLRNKSALHTERQ